MRTHHIISVIVFSILCLSFTMFPLFAHANDKNEKYASLVIDADTGLVLHADNPDKPLHPASLTKMMTMLMVFEALDARRISLHSRVRISKHAASMVPSKLNIPAGNSINVRDALYALATKSANDVAVGLAEKIGQSEPRFAQMMTRRARTIGMSRTTFKNASGLHDPQQISTARDMAKLAQFIVKRYPHHYHYFGTKSFSYAGQTYNNHNKLLGTYRGADGFKTGFISKSGFNLVASARRDDTRIIGVVFGGETGKSRNAHMVTLLDKGFKEVDHVRIAAARKIPRPDRKPDPALLQAQLASTTAPASGGYDDNDFTSMTSLAQQNTRRQPLTQTEQVLAASPIPANKPQFKNMDIGTFSEAVEQGSYDPSGTRRLETAQIAAAAHKGGSSSQTNAIQSVAYTSDNYDTKPWSIQIGAFGSKAHSNHAIRRAMGELSSSMNLSALQGVIMPLRTADGILYRARLTGFAQNDAKEACKRFQDCMTIAP